MAGFSLYVSNTTSTKQGYLCYKDHTTGTPSLDQNISCSIYGRYVIYYNERSHNRPSYLSQYAYNELCELQVFGEYILIFIFFLFLSSNSCSSFFFRFFSFYILDRVSRKLWRWLSVCLSEKLSEWEL